MINYQLSNFLSINGIGSASGIVYLDNILYLIGDNSGFLYQYNLDFQSLKKYPLIDNAVTNIAKKDKPDFESITLRNNKMYIFGSGSTKKREIRVKFNLQTCEIKCKDVSNLYDKLKLKANFTNDDLNIEGSFFYNKNLYLLNRGNGLLKKNGIFIYDIETESIDHEFFQLPKINNFESSFTDGIVFENKIYFLATAENTESTYLDGEIYGSLIGIIDPQTMEIEGFLKISDNQKFEGLTFYSKNQNEINFLVCEDNDTEVLVSNIYKLTIHLS